MHVASGQETIPDQATGTVSKTGRFALTSVAIANQTAHNQRPESFAHHLASSPTRTCRPCLSHADRTSRCATPGWTAS